MEKNHVITKRGHTMYYTMDNTYPDAVSFHVKYPDELSECEFVVPSTIIQSPEDEETLVVLFTNGYEKGRQRGKWIRDVVRQCIGKKPRE